MSRRQQCLSMRAQVEFHAPSARDPKVVYTIRGIIRDGDLVCSCPGFTHRGTCKHLTVEYESCGWTEGEGREQSGEQHDGHECPDCGSRTVDVAVRVDADRPAGDDGSPKSERRGIGPAAKDSPW
jgi:hypothetical protein